MSEPLKSSQGALWVSTTPGKSPEYLGCIDLDPIVEPAGDQTLVNCRNRDGVIEAATATQAPPGAITTSIKAWIYPSSNILDEIKSCAVNVFALQRTCGRADVFGNYVRGFVLGSARVSNRSFENLVMREADEPSIQSLDISARTLSKLREVTVSRQTVAETRDINDITFCNAEQCAGDCGEQKDAGTDGYAVSDGGVASPPSDADVWLTTDKGATWANATGLVPSPFAGGNIIAAVCFPIGKDTTRLLVASGAKAGSAEVAYSDDDGATWATVDVGAVDWEGCAGAAALFALDWTHIWFATDHGRVYFSDDGGLTWTSQSSALTASAAKQLNAVVFTDYDNGWACGNSDIVMRTLDGGTTWTALTSPTTSDNVTALDAWTKYRAIIGSNAGEVYETWDGGATWEAKTYTAQTGTDTVRYLQFYNDLVGYMLVNTSAPVGAVHRSKDGGATWEKLTTPANAGLNALEAIDENHAFVAGNAYGGTGVILQVSG
jgi:photosystem II stability/assembly factor-like uncharacterized protein